MTIQHKNKLLIFGFFAILFFGYYLSISETLSVKANYDKLITEEALFKNIPERLHALNQKEVHYSKLLINNQITETSLQNNLLRMVEKYAQTHSIDDITLLEPHTASTGNRTISSYMFDVTGDFKSILGLGYELEQKSKFGMVASLRFEKKKELKNNRTYLQATFVLQILR